MFRPRITDATFNISFHASVTSGGGYDLTLLVAHHQHRGGVPGDHGVRQQEVQELGHVTDLLLEDGAVHHEHDGPAGARPFSNVKRTFPVLNTESLLVRLGLLVQSRLLGSFRVAPACFRMATGIHKPVLKTTLNKFSEMCNSPSG